MEPLDTDMDYVVRETRPARSESRMNALLILPIIGVIFMLVFISAGIFQLDLTNIVDSLMGLMMLLFFVFIGLLFWGLAPRAHRS
jgi:hypothetical protein